MSVNLLEQREEAHTFPLHVRGTIPAALEGSLIIPCSRRLKNRHTFSRWQDSQADLIRLDLYPGKPGRVSARILPAESGVALPSYCDALGFAAQPNHAVNVSGSTAWATNLLFGAPIEIDLTSWSIRRALQFVTPDSDAPRISTTSHFAWSLDHRYAYFHQSLLRREHGKEPVQTVNLRLIELDTVTGGSQTWRLDPPIDDDCPEAMNFHSMFCYEDGGRRYVGMLRTGAVLERLAPRSSDDEYSVIPSPLSEIWIVEVKRDCDSLQATLLPGIRDLGMIALSHLAVDASSSNGFVLYANCKQADVAEETRGENVYGERPESVCDLYNGMIVEAFNVGTVLRYEKRGSDCTLRTFTRQYDPGNTSLGHTWLPINIQLDSSRQHLFCSFNGFHPRLLSRHIAAAYGDRAVDAASMRYVPSLLLRMNAATLEPEYDRDRTYLSYAEPMPTAVCGSADDGFVCTFSPEVGLRIYRADNLNIMVGHAVAAQMESWEDTHFRPEPAHMAFVPR